MKVQTLNNCLLTSGYEVWLDPSIPNRPPCQNISQRLLELPTIMEPVQDMIGSNTRLFFAIPVLIRAGQGEIYWQRKI